MSIVYPLGAREIDEYYLKALYPRHQEKILSKFFREEISELEDWCCQHGISPEYVDFKVEPDRTIRRTSATLIFHFRNDGDDLLFRLAFL